MSFLNILFAVLVLGILGLIFGAILAIAGKVFAVEKDPRYDEIMELLPGANCGGCGFAGCSSYAEAIVAGNAGVNCCPASSDDAKAKIAEIMGVQLTKNERITALVRCNGGTRAKKKFEYMGLSDCVAAMRVGGGPLECQFGCLGMGTCVSACPFGAIAINENGVAQVNSEICTGCLKCVAVCPRNIIIPVPYTADVTVVCASHAKGAELRKICDIGCIGCKICVKTCKHDAIHVEDNLASIDYTKCTGCGECAEKCPRHLIVNSKLMEVPEVIVPETEPVTIAAEEDH